MRVRRSPATGAPGQQRRLAVRGLLDAGRRRQGRAFSYGAAHWFTGPIVSWAIANQVSEAAITDGLIFMAVTMIIVRTAGLRVRASRLPAPAPAPSRSTPRPDPAPTRPPPARETPRRAARFAVPASTDRHRSRMCS